MTTGGLSLAVRDLLGSDELAPSQTLGEIMGKIPDAAFLGSQLKAREGRDQAAGGNGAFYGLGLLLSSYRYTEGLRAAGRLENRRHYMERAFKLIDENMPNPLAHVLRELALHLGPAQK